MQVPRYNGPQVQQAPTANVRVNDSTSLESFGGGRAVARTGQALQGVANQAFEVIRKEKEKADDAAVQDAYARTVKMKNNLMFGQEGAITKQGKNSFGIVNEYGSQFDTDADEIESTLNNDVQRAQYRLIREREKMSLDSDLQRHVYTESRKYENETFKSTVETTREDAILHYNDQQKVDGAVSIQKAAIIDYAQKNGLPPEWTKRSIQEAESRTYTDIIDRMLANGDDLGAEKYFNDRKDSFTSSDSSRLQKNLEEGSLRGKSQRAMDSIVSKSSDMQSALTQARKIEDPKLRDETERRVKDYFQTQEAAERERQNNIFDSAARRIEQTKTRDSITPGEWNAMTLQQRNALDNRIEQLRRGETPVTDRKVYYDLTNTVENDRQKFLKMNLMEYSPYLSEGDFKKFADMQADAKKGSNQKLDGFLSDNQVVDSVLSQMNINPKAKPDTDAGRKAAKFREMVDQQVIAYQESTGKKADNDTIRKITNQLAVQGIIEKNWWPDERKYAFELEGDEEFSDIVVPPSDQREITIELQRRGKPVTDKAIKQWYLRGLNAK